MRDASLWRALLGVDKTVIEQVEFDEDEQLLVAQVRPRSRARSRCGVCGRSCPGYDGGEGRRRWRALDLGTVQVVLEADAPRVSCRQHGVVVAAVPWARHGAGHTYAFDEQVAWLATQASKTTVTQLMRIAWRTVGSIITRVWADTERQFDRFAGLKRIGIDEISYKRGHRYLTIVVDHDSGRLVWAAPGRDKATLHAFFDALGEQRCAAVTHVSADGADWIAKVVTQRCPQAVRCADPFHVVSWATDALDEVRRDAWNQARGAVTRRRAGRASGHAKDLKGARYALWKNPGNLTEKQQAKLAWVARTDPRLYRGYLLKEGLRLVFQLPHQQAAEALDRWVAWARRCRIEAFVTLQRRIVKHRDSILAAIEHGLSNGRIESVNTKVRLITRIAFGFRSPESLIALAMLSLGGHRPVLPGRN
ncbi:ISL3 family transposase [Intrasporangium calvum]|uniref:Transposase IS204/IS1001/IS1096/IS1165 family protein n=1 Tax=Intrasporangium calvum (strain ATCC 23552 / DSM 43043 / JCM 3097 / NBRC 12989 / NCIMB 10167 / NRRL B-3866 / 7 KIP) TaxID=710696 RepID=E6S8T8_INTC7|nr:ISL3 family transposase [Intrasporangium calvum]ADU47104.1 transposase IS204/IS1001/IS1096/IS1165 family protein [Intrasporangium calvum DSM 43043]ADU47327.1 transposase IS204/IS1001/IS1096/IS1165 family protein [Intrasporangium calvum DSM 43043]ADU47404.1 transposase IS204/IS1001/IS1096/IS1165 family protein [Intrasporangium calvum DSM 43043]ADU48075.1 transposase IS204/IS1001/IS1096/IS1165 family protein [Intrasporangium calvum DSM 43043]ADU49992.1 transposase IS204/IS1001/IS1096/IS1165 f